MSLLQSVIDAVERGLSDAGTVARGSWREARVFATAWHMAEKKVLQARPGAYVPSIGHFSTKNVAIRLWKDLGEKTTSCQI